MEQALGESIDPQATEIGPPQPGNPQEQLIVQQSQAMNLNPDDILGHLESIDLGNVTPADPQRVVIDPLTAQQQKAMDVDPPEILVRRSSRCKLGCEERLKCSQCKAKYGCAHQVAAYILRNNLVASFCGVKISNAAFLGQLGVCDLTKWAQGVLQAVQKGPC